MSKISDVKVKITQKKVIGKVGFGIPLIFAGKQATAVPYTLCKGLEAVKQLFNEDTESYKAAKQLFLQENAPEKIAVCAGTGKATDELSKVFDQEWRQLLVVSQGLEGESSLKEIADYIEAKNDKMFFCSVEDLNSLKALGLNALNRTVAIVYTGSPNLSQVNNKELKESLVCYPEAALVGATAGLDVGSFTYKNIVLTGIEPEGYEELELDEIHTNGGICIVKKAGDVVTSEGLVLSGEYADVIDSKDYIVKNIEYQVQKVLNINHKLPYDARGIGLLENTVINVLKDAYNNGIIAEDEDGNPMFQTAFEGREDASEENRRKRKYTGGTFQFTIAGAIHNVEIMGELEI